MQYLVIDASLNGTGIRDEYEGNYIDPSSLGINSDLLDRINSWLLKYEAEHYKGYMNNSLIEELDNEGKELAIQIKKELKNVKIAYYSDAKMDKTIIY
ncbi:hypothetical protein [Leptospira noguchii]|uniref:hypothetical protein n=1 Tax=Leptospira noguchii TaxID=28182 RepID=UPI00055C30E9|nr:hypothetical protein [Leptospira noguchii]UOG43612.1 hypothetical protein MAL05_19025 [Leptospira noguchii]